MGLAPLLGNWAIPLDFLVWFAIQAGAGYLAARLPDGVFARDNWLYRQRPWEAGGRLYVRLLLVGRWKQLLPDSAVVLGGGFGKAHLREVSPAYLQTFILETRRAELTHWLPFAALPVFLIWSEWPVMGWMVAYALAANLPCLVVQRYNRCRLQRVCERLPYRRHAETPRHA
jgi:glycosyl-4,4'-diaponeurosporenoate acyltransferase